MNKNKDKYVSICESEDQDEDPLEKLLNKICFGTGKDGRTFRAKLIVVRDKELFFETESSMVIMDDRDQIISIYEVA